MKFKCPHCHQLCTRLGVTDSGTYSRYQEFVLHGGDHPSSIGHLRDDRESTELTRTTEQVWSTDCCKTTIAADESTAMAWVREHSVPDPLPEERIDG